MMPFFQSSMLELIIQTSTNVPPDVRAAMAVALRQEQPETRAGQALAIIGPTRWTRSPARTAGTTWAKARPSCTSIRGPARHRHHGRARQEPARRGGGSQWQGAGEAGSQVGQACDRTGKNALSPRRIHGQGTSRLERARRGQRHLPHFQAQAQTRQVTGFPPEEQAPGKVTAHRPLRIPTPGPRDTKL